MRPCLGTFRKAMPVQIFGSVEHKSTFTCPYRVSRNCTKLHKFLLSVRTTVMSSDRHTRGGLLDVTPCRLVYKFSRFREICCLHYSSTLKTDAEVFSETLVNIYKPTRRHTPDNSNIDSHQGSRQQARAPLKKKFSGSPAMADRLKTWLSVAE